METIDLTPTWSGLLPGMIAVLENQDAPVRSRMDVLEEFRTMARAADIGVAAHKKEQEGS